MIQISLLTIYSIRYSKFIKVKQFFSDNEYYYKKDGYYYPNKVFNIDSFPIGVTINILLINLLYIIIPQKFHIESCNNNNCDNCNCSEN